MNKGGYFLMRSLFRLLIFLVTLMGALIARGDSVNGKSIINDKINIYYFSSNLDGDTLYKKRSHKRRKIKRKPRRGRDNK